MLLLRISNDLFIRQELMLQICLTFQISICIADVLTVVIVVILATLQCLDN